MASYRQVSAFRQASPRRHSWDRPSKTPTKLVESSMAVAQLPLAGAGRSPANSVIVVPGDRGHFVETVIDADAHATAAQAFLGRPPSLPFARTAVVLAGDVALPPALPSCAAIQRREPRKPSRSPGR